MLLPVALLAASQVDPETTRVIIERTWLDQVATISQSLVSLLVLVMLGTATFALLALRRALDELTRLVRSTSSDITGAVHDARKVVEELRSLSGRVRGTADLVGAGVRKARRMVDGLRDTDTDTDERPARLDRTERAERPERKFEEQSMAEVNREERSLRKRRRRRRTDRPDRPRSDEGGGREGTGADEPAE